MADLTSDFPRAELLGLAAPDDVLRTDDKKMFSRAIAAYDALSDRYVLDTTELKAEVGNLRAEIQRLQREVEQLSGASFVVPFIRRQGGGER